MRRGVLRALDNGVTRWPLVIAADAVGLTLMGFLSSATCFVKSAFKAGSKQEGEVGLEIV